MILKKKSVVFVIFILILVLIVSAAVSNFQKKSSIGRQKVTDEIQRVNQIQASQSAQNLQNEKKIFPTPLVSNLPSGVSANVIGSIDGKAGKATVIAVSDKGIFSLVLEAKLTDPPQGQYYVAWLGKNKDDKNLLKLGKLQKDKDSYNISFSQDGDFSAYKVAVVTLEKNEGDKPETIILEGAF